MLPAAPLKKASFDIGRVSPQWFLLLKKQDAKMSGQSSNLPPRPIFPGHTKYIEYNIRYMLRQPIVCWWWYICNLLCLIAHAFLIKGSNRCTCSSSCCYKCGPGNVGSNKFSWPREGSCTMGDKPVLCCCCKKYYFLLGTCAAVL